MPAWLRNEYVAKWLRNADAWLANCQTLKRIFFVLLGIQLAAFAFAYAFIVPMFAGWFGLDPHKSFPLGADAIVLAMACTVAMFIFGGLAIVEAVVRIWPYRHDTIAAELARRVRAWVAQAFR